MGNPELLSASAKLVSLVILTLVFVWVMSRLPGLMALVSLVAAVSYGSVFVASIGKRIREGF